MGGAHQLGLTGTRWEGLVTWVSGGRGSLEGGLCGSMEVGGAHV